MVGSDLVWLENKRCYISLEPFHGRDAMLLLFQELATLP